MTMATGFILDHVRLRARGLARRAHANGATPRPVQRAAAHALRQTRASALATRRAPPSASRRSLAAPARETPAAPRWPHRAAVVAPSAPHYRLDYRSAVRGQGLIITLPLRG